VIVVVLLAVAVPATPAGTGDLTFKNCIAKFVSNPCGFVTGGNAVITPSYRLDAMASKQSTH
jgi:hypothetical protein